MDRCVVDALMALPERSRFMKGLFAWVGFPSEPIYYSPAERLHGVSRFRPTKLLRFAVDGLTAFTTWPLRLLSLLGAVLAMLSFSYGLFIIFKHLLYGDAVRGWATLITVVLFFRGGEYALAGCGGRVCRQYLCRGQAPALVSGASSRGRDWLRPLNRHLTRSS